MKFSGQITGSGGLTITGGSGGNLPGTAPYLLVLDGLNNNYTGNTTINNATVTNDVNVNPAVNILPATTVLTLTNSAAFAIYSGNASQTLAGLNGDKTSAVGTENNSSPTSLFIDPAAGATYTFAGTIGDLDVLGRGNGGTTGTATHRDLQRARHASADWCELLYGRHNDQQRHAKAWQRLRLGHGRTDGQRGSR